jgi:hypothetical protein
MNILGGHESYNTPAKKWCKWWRSSNEIPPYTTLNIYTLLNVFVKHKQTKKILRGFPCISQNFEGFNKADSGLSAFTFVRGRKKFNNFNRWEKKDILTKMNDLTDRKSNKKRAKTSEAWRKITKGNQSQVEEGGGGRGRGV